MYRTGIVMYWEHTTVVGPPLLCVMKEIQMRMDWGRGKTVTERTCMSSGESNM